MFEIHQNNILSEILSNAEIKKLLSVFGCFVQLHQNGPLLYQADLVSNCLYYKQQASINFSNIIDVSQFMNNFIKNF